MKSPSTCTHHVILAFLAVVMTRSFASSLSMEAFVEEAKIVGGQDAVKDRYPYMVSLQSWGRHECGGSMVAPDVVLTAAHCAHDYITKAFLNRRDLKNDNEANSQVFDIQYFVKHPGYTVDTDRHDVAVFKLIGQTNLSTIVMNNNSYLLTDGMEFTVMGFGDLGNFSYPNILQEVVVNYIPADACRAFKDPMRQGVTYENTLFNDMMCALGDGKDGCSGDSGGPLVVKGNSYNEDVLVGAVSWGIGCARLPGVYAKIDAMFGWISRTVCRVSDNPPAYLQCSSQTQPSVVQPSWADANRDDSSPPSPTRSPTRRRTRRPTRRPTRMPTSY